MQSSLSDDPDWRSAIDLAAALRHRETSAAETLEAVLERADRVGPVLNPFSVQLYQRAGEAARLGLVSQETNSAVKRTKIAQGPAMKGSPTPPDTPMSEDTTG